MDELNKVRSEAFVNTPPFLLDIIQFESSRNTLVDRKPKVLLEAGAVINPIRCLNRINLALSRMNVLLEEPALISHDVFRLLKINPDGTTDVKHFDTEVCRILKNLRPNKSRKRCRNRSRPTR